MLKCAFFPFLGSGLCGGGNGRLVERAGSSGSLFSVATPSAAVSMAPPYEDLVKLDSLFRPRSGMLTLATFLRCTVAPLPK